MARKTPLSKDMKAAGRATINNPDSGKGKVPAKIGRPLKIPTPEIFAAKAQEFFDRCDKTGKLKTITGLAVHLGIWRTRIYEYMEQDGFRDVVKNALAICEHEIEELALTTKSAAGPIFVLKNYGWTDRQQLEHVGEQRIRIEIAGKYPDPPKADTTIAAEAPEAEIDNAEYSVEEESGKAAPGEE